MFDSMRVVLLILALVLVVLELIDAGGKSKLVWAVLIILVLVAGWVQ